LAIRIMSPPIEGLHELTMGGGQVLGWAGPSGVPY